MNASPFGIPLYSVFVLISVFWPEDPLLYRTMLKKVTDNPLLQGLVTVDLSRRSGYFRINAIIRICVLALFLSALAAKRSYRLGPEVALPKGVLVSNLYNAQHSSLFPFVNSQSAQPYICSLPLKFSIFYNFSPWLSLSIIVGPPSPLNIYLTRL
jgi:hypothetical protein